MPQALARTGETPAALLRRDAMLPSENNSVPSSARPRPSSVSAPRPTAASRPNSRTSPDTPSTAATPVRPVIGAPKKTRALTALKTVDSEKTTETSPEGMRDSAL